MRTVDLWSKVHGVSLGFEYLCASREGRLRFDNARKMFFSCYCAQLAVPLQPVNCKIQLITNYISFSKIYE